MLRHGRLLLAALALAGCHGNAPHTVRGETVLLGGAEVWSWVNVDTEGQVYELGVTLPMLAIDALTDGTTLRLGLPPEASQTFVDHVVLAYEAKGHGPAAYRAAQLDVRYFGVSRAVQEAIDCRSEERPAEIPAPFTLEAPLECAPGVGLRAYDPTADELAPQQPAPFRHALALGYHGGALAMIEAMIVDDQLRRGTNFQLPVPRPALGRSTRWPAATTGTYNSIGKVYFVALTRLKPL